MPGKRIESSGGDGIYIDGGGSRRFCEDVEIRDGAVLTPPVTAGILDGITRRSIMRLLSDDGIEVKEASLSRSDLYYADEMFLTGTAAEVTPIRSVDHRQVGNGHPGPITLRAQDLFRQAVTGKLDAYLNWLDFV